MQLAEALCISQEVRQSDEPTLPIFLACGFTPLHLQTFLAAHLRLVFPERPIGIDTGVYGDLPGNLERALAKSFTTVVAVLEWPDLDARLGFRRLGGWGPGCLASIVEDVTINLQQMQSRLLALSQVVDVVVALPSLPLPPVGPAPGWRFSAWQANLEQALASFATELAQASRIRLVNSRYLDLLSPAASRYNAKGDLFAGFPYTIAHADVLGRALAELVRGPRPKKGLITDLDDTLWKGILGEDGPAGISWQDHAHVHALYQQLLRALAEAGILIAVASKNSPALVEQAFARQDLLLEKAQIFPLEVSWGPKSESVSRILASWNIGAGSAVFVDDSPMELAEVKAAHPDVECLLFPKEPDQVIALLHRLRDQFGKDYVTEEDLVRLQSLRASALSPLRDSAGGGVEDFLSKADAEITVSFSKEPWDPRALELINKTNQFNLNGRRHTEATLRQMLRAPDTFLAVLSYRDRYGPLGKIAVAAGRHNGTKLKLDSWVMSCRAFSRRIEHQCLKVLLEKFNAGEVCLDYEATPRNEPLQEFLTSLLGHPPQHQVTLPSTIFRQRCPQLYHRLREITHE